MINNICSFAIGNITYDLFDTGLANVLGLETLRHGINIINYLEIRIKGGEPTCGGKISGSAKGLCSGNENYFYVFKDSECASPSDFEKLGAIFRIKGVQNRALARFHSGLSGYNFVAQFFSHTESQSLLVKCLLVFFVSIGVACNVFISPTLRFRFSKLDLTRFENDPIYDNMAYRTKQTVEPWRIGLLDTLLTGINLEWFARAKAHPLKIFTGIVQLTCAIAITILCVNTLINNPILAIPAVAGALLA